MKYYVYAYTHLRTRRKKDILLVWGDDMKCENELCVYCQRGSCTIETSIDAAGRCHECTYPNFEYSVLEQAKLDFFVKHREVLDREWEEDEE